MKELQKNSHYKILQVELPSGASMPRHFATSDAFVVVEAGHALLICKNETCELSTGSSVSIPAHEPHMLKVIADFKAYVVLANDALVSYPENLS